MTASRELSSKRELHIEGLRAISCFMVLLGHCLIGFVPSYVYNMFPVKLLWYASFAIDYFFIISGYGICSKFIGKGHVNCVKETILRYIKIVIPVYVSCLLPYLFMKLGWMWNIEAYSVTKKQWLSWYYNWPPNFLEASISGLFGVFVGVGTKYNGVLWTIHIEFIGTFLLLFFMDFMKRINVGKHTQYVIMLSLTVLFIILHSYLALFFYGAAVRMIRYNFEEDLKNSKTIIVLFILANLSVFLFPGSGQGVTLMTASIPFMGCACIIFTCICFCPLLKRSLSIKPLQIIAQYSTGIYFLQLPLICSIQSKIYVQLIHKGGFIAFIAAVTTTLIILGGLVFVFNNTIMKISVGFAARIAQYELLKKIGSRKP